VYLFGFITRTCSHVYTQGGTGVENRGALYRRRQEIVVKSLSEKCSMQQKENSKREPLAGRKSSPVKSVVRTAGREVKPSISPSSELVVSSGSEEEDGWGKEI